MSEPPVTADHTPERLSAEEVTHLFERVAWKVHDHDGNLVGYHIEADMWREVRAHFLAAHTAALRAECDALREQTARVEALADELAHYDGAVMSSQRWGEGFLAGLSHAADAITRTLHPQDPDQERTSG